MISIQVRRIRRSYRMTSGQVGIVKRGLATGLVIVSSLFAATAASAAPTIEQCKQAVGIASAPHVEDCSCVGSSLIVEFEAGPDQREDNSPVCTGGSAADESDGATNWQLANAGYEDWFDGFREVFERLRFAIWLNVSRLNNEALSLYEDLGDAQKILSDLKNNPDGSEFQIRRWTLEVAKLEQQLSDTQAEHDRLQAELDKLDQLRTSILLGGQTQFATVTPAGKGDRRMSFRTSLADVRRALAGRAASERGLAANGGGLPGLIGDDRFNAWIGASISLTDDRRRGAKADGEEFEVKAGASYRVRDDITVGGKLRYRNADSDRNDNSASASMDGFGGALFAEIVLPRGILFSPLVAYERTDTDLDLGSGGTATSGDFGTDIFTFGAGLSQRFAFAQPEQGRILFVEPNTSVSYVIADREKHTRSDGTTVSGKTVEQGTLSFGPRFGFLYAQPTENIALLEPTLSVSGIWNFKTPDSFLSTSGSLVKTPEFYGSVGIGLNMQLVNGIDASLSAGYSGIGAKTDRYSLSTRLSLPLN